MASCQPTIAHRVDVLFARVCERLWPGTCVLCGGAGERGRDLCAKCERDLPCNPRACVRCAMPLALDESEGALCGQCLLRPPHFDACFAPFRYAYPLDRLIHSLKYRGHMACGRVLGELLVERLLAQPHAERPQILIPTPLAPRRYRERGFNQAREIALPIARALGVDVRCDVLIRLRDTGEQAGLAQAERRRNVHGAFAVTKALPAEHIAILDDVVTTGSTASEMAQALRRAGAQRIEVWAMARSV